MLYYIFRWLDQFGISGSHLWGYISFRAIMAMILALIISAWFGEKFIKYLKKKQITEVQRDASIDHLGLIRLEYLRWAVSLLLLPYSFLLFCWGVCVIFTSFS